MSVEAIEAYVENGQVRLPSNTHLPEHAKVYVIVPEIAQEAAFDVAMEQRKSIRIASPRLARREDAAHFRKTFVKDAP